VSASLSVLGASTELVAGPKSITASRVEQGKTIRTHPLCAYPKEAHYRGTGSTGDAANYECVVPSNHD